MTDKDTQIRVRMEIWVNCYAMILLRVHLTSVPCTTRRMSEASEITYGRLRNHFGDFDESRRNNTVPCEPRLNFRVKWEKNVFNCSKTKGICNTNISLACRYQMPFTFLQLVHTWRVKEWLLQKLITEQWSSLFEENLWEFLTIFWEVMGFLRFHLGATNRPQNVNENGNVEWDFRFLDLSLLLGVRCSISRFVSLYIAVSPFMLMHYRRSSKRAFICKIIHTNSDNQWLHCCLYFVRNCFGLTKWPDTLLTTVMMNVNQMISELCIAFIVSNK